MNSHFDEGIYAFSAGKGFLDNPHLEAADLTAARVWIDGYVAAFIAYRERHSQSRNELAASIEAHREGRVHIHSTTVLPGDVITIEGISTKRPMRYQP